MMQYPMTLPERLLWLWWLWAGSWHAYGREEAVAEEVWGNHW